MSGAICAYAFSLRPQGRFSALSLLSNLSSCVRGLIAALIVVCAAASAHAVVVRGTVTDRLGAAVIGAHINLMQEGKVVTSAVSGSDGSFELTAASTGRFVVTGIGRGFGLAVSEEFYSGKLSVITEELILKPASVNDYIIVTATGVPTPQAQLTGTVDVIHGEDLKTRVGILDNLRLMPGVNVVQTGQTGGVTSLFIRGGPSTGDKVLVDGIPANDIGGLFDFGTISSTGLERVEVYRGPDSVIYGADATSGVLSFETPRGVTAKPEFQYSGDAGDYHSYRNEIRASGTRNKLDYLAGFSRFDTSNAIELDRYHDATSVANLGYSIGATQARFTIRNSVSATGVPGAYDFSHMTSDEKQADQDLYMAGTLENRTKDDWHNLVRYAVTRKREQLNTYSQVGNPMIATEFGFTDLYFVGNGVTIRGANGYSASGRAILGEEGTTFPNRSDEVNNTDEFQYATDYRFTPTLRGHTAASGTTTRRECVLQPGSSSSRTMSTARTMSYTESFQGDIKNRVFYSLWAAAWMKNHVFGVKASPQIRFGVVSGPSGCRRFSMARSCASTSPRLCRSWISSLMSSRCAT